MCPDCNAARITTGHHRMFSPSCLYCGARLIQTIGKVGNTDAEITQRRRVVLKDWMALGHDEQELRELAGRKVGEKLVMALEPVQKERANADR
jgi:ribosomal protein S27E